ncbi:hypothetical protein KC19_4G224700 [Ceratodon purpureus]|uniref:Ribosomal L1 domain-containing protein 1 n=1 Tax=Ceratodon purpureus TaxID=3225 RepID=A0A8T0IF16_CERPU|nr:hypothetical protein KC19_4G224700 [Ceratodon purpureus]
MAVSMETEGAGGGSGRKGGRVDAVLVGKAVDALLKWSGAQKQQAKAQLLEDDQLVYVVVGMNKVPDKGRTNPCSVTLPHPLYQMDGSREICLIVSDRENGKVKLNKQTAKGRIEKEGLNIAKVIPLSKLKKDYFSFEAKRKLCGSYDIFLADDRILGELPKLLGKAFYKKKKHPIPVNLTRAQWAGQITAALNSTFVYVSGGTCSVVKVARVSQTREEIIANVNAVVEGVAQQIPRKWANIRALFLKTLESVALPLYQSLPEMPLKIELPGLSQLKSSEPLKKKPKLVEGSKEKVARSSKNESAEVGDKMDVVVEDAVVDAEKLKKRKRKDTGDGKRKAVRA